MLKHRGGHQFVQLALHGFRVREDQLHGYAAQRAAFDDVIGFEDAGEAADTDEVVQSICILDRLTFELAPESGIRGVHWNSYSNQLGAGGGWAVRTARLETRHFPGVAKPLADGRGLEMGDLAP